MADAIAKTLIVNDASRAIVGVMPAGLAFSAAATRVWLPVKHTDSANHAGVARLASGVTAQQAQAELAAVLARKAELFPLRNGSGMGRNREGVRFTSRGK